LRAERETIIMVAEAAWKKPGRLTNSATKPQPKKQDLCTTEARSRGEEQKINWFYADR